MIPFREYLIESNRQNLFHGSERMLSILKSNTLKDNTSQHIDGKILKGVSLSRNLKSSIAFGSIVLELSANKLRNKHKIFPFNWNYSYKAGKNLTISSREYKDKNGEKYKQTENEEFVVGSIKNLNQYIEYVWLPYSYKGKPYDESLKKELEKYKIKYHKNGVPVND